MTPTDDAIKALDHVESKKASLEDFNAYSGTYIDRYGETIRTALNLLRQQRAQEVDGKHELDERATCIHCGVGAYNFMGPICPKRTVPLSTPHPSPETVTYMENIMTTVRCIPLERIKAVIDYYARREHWMAVQEDAVARTFFVAMRGSGPQDGWTQAESIQDDLWALEQLIDQLSRTKAECFLTIDRMNEERRSGSALYEADIKTAQERGE